MRTDPVFGLSVSVLEALGRQQVGEGRGLAVLWGRGRSELHQG